MERAAPARSSEGEDDPRFRAAAGRRLALPGGEGPERAWSGDWSFIVMADTQLGMQESGNDEVTWADELRMLEIAVQHINRLQPKFVVVCGDMAHAFPAGAYPTPEAFPKGGQAELRPAQVADYKRAISKVDKHIALVCCCGNHDVGDEPNRATMTQYGSEFGDDYFSFAAGGCRCLVCNTSLFSAMEAGRYEEKVASPWAAAVPATPEEKAQAQALQAEQIEWLRTEAATKSSAVHTFAFGHIPPFIFRPDEPKECEQTCRRASHSALSAFAHGPDGDLLMSQISTWISRSAGS